MSLRTWNWIFWNLQNLLFRNRTKYIWSPSVHPHLHVMLSSLSSKMTEILIGGLHRQVNRKAESSRKKLLASTTSLQKPFCSTVYVLVSPLDWRKVIYSLIEQNTLKRKCSWCEPNRRLMRRWLTLWKFDMRLYSFRGWFVLYLIPYKNYSIHQIIDTSNSMTIQ